MVFFLSQNILAQDATDSVQKPGYQFIPVVELKVTPVKNQASTGTCWCFATVSFIESELLRMGKGEHDLSEMFIVRHNYVNRLRDNYLRRGKGNLSQGSLAHNAFNVIREHGLVPDGVYSGINYDSERHNHRELNRFIQAIGQIPVDIRKESPEYKELVNSLLDIYLGPLPETFTYKGENYTAPSFFESLDFNPDDYVEITSFNHFPFYTTFPLEVPDNWAHGQFYNVPLDELIEIMDYSLQEGYTVNWDGDVSEKGFSHKNGVAINPDVEAPVDTYSTTDRARFEKMTTEEKLEEVYKFEEPYPEIVVDQEIRQQGYEGFTTTDDHLMHVTGITRDQNGTKYYITKNSWGTERNTFGGYLNMSESFVRAKTIYIMVHKDAIPRHIKRKLGL
ncbi:MAG: C1 family peptidase [Bacteroides sp.]|nr:C1 family peptidase [Bacteroides sp.]